MKNPVTFSISEARKIQKKRQVRLILLLSAIIVVLLGSILIYQVANTKQKIDAVFPSEASISQEDRTELTGIVTQMTAETAEATPSQTQTSSETTTSTSDGATSSQSSTDDQGSVTESTVPTTQSTAPVAVTEENVYISKSKTLQTINHEQRDSAYNKLQNDVQQLINSKQVPIDSKQPQTTPTTNIRCGFYYINLQNQEAFGYNDMDAFVMGSAINLPINMVLYNQIRSGVISPDEVMTYEAQDFVAGPGTLQTTPMGSQHYIRELSQLSIMGGDNSATAMLLRKLGGIDEVNNQMKQISDVVDFRNPVLYKDYSGTQQKGINRSSPQDMAAYAQNFYQLYMSTPDVYQPLFNDLAHSETDWGVGSGLPTDLLICHKTGSNLAFGAQTDVALIFADEPFILCVTTESADPVAGQALQQQLGKLVYDYVHSCYSKS